MAEPGPESNAKHHIPFFFYDVIGRMLPGAYLMLGVMLCFLPFFCWQRLVSFLRDLQALGMSGGLAAVVIGTGLLFLGLVSSFFGFILAPLSFLVVEKGLWHRSPLNYAGLVKFLGMKDLGSLDARFKRQFGSELTKESQESLNPSSFLCAYYIWRTGTTLGEIEGRLDADLLAAQSFLFVSLVLMAAVLSEIFFVGLSTYLIVWFAVLSAISVASGMAFNYHRKKRVYGRFGLFLAVTDAPAESEGH